MDRSRDLFRIVRALRHRNYRLFFIGQGISLIGTWMQQVAQGWLVFRLTGSPFYLGLVGFADKIPVFLLTSFAGVLVDRVPKARLLIWTQALALAQAAILAFLTLRGTVEPWQVVALASFLGIINALDIPARQSFVVEMLESREDLPNAIALNSTIFNGARLIGPSLGGLLVAWTGEGICFLINALSFVAVLIALWRMDSPVPAAAPRAGSPWRDLKEGLGYAFDFVPARAILFLLCLFGLAVMPYTVLLPDFARNVLGGGANAFGLLMAATGAGALAGALFLASRKNVLGLGRWIIAASSLFSLSMIAFSFTCRMEAALALMVTAGFGMMVQLASCNTILQTIVDDDKRGRVISLYVIAVAGIAPFGSLLVGILADAWGAPAAFRIGGAAGLAGSLAFAAYLPTIRKHTRPIYIRMGLLRGEASAASAGEFATRVETLER